MSDKISGKTFLGGGAEMARDFHPLPWRVQRYDANRGGCGMSFDRGRFENPPGYGAEDALGSGDTGGGGYEGMRSSWGGL